ncbi:MAG TPA: hypothetical protein VHF25_09655 [Nitriliruptorales bacterium]|nr:hypothetical protein [Nitriliruptorales bacterium]
MALLPVLGVIVLILGIVSIVRGGLLWGILLIVLGIALGAGAIL